MAASVWTSLSMVRMAPVVVQDASRSTRVLKKDLMGTASLAEC